MEEVEQFDNISIEDLVEGVSVSANSDPLTLTTDVVQNYQKILRGSSSCHMSIPTKTAESLSRSCSSIGLLIPVRLGC